ncbi:MAG: hypothetical protein FJ315_05590 [SAR202 cluster bacterium]|nr:hypothetical protein [SAR202 cluster bacterium]
MLTFEQGDPSRPKGHALLYFRDVGSPGRLVATYVVVLPVSVDVVRYMPPFLAPHAAELAGKGLSALAFPPLPEAVEGEQRLRQLADARGDDLLSGGALDLTQVQVVLERVNDQVQDYAEAYNTFVSTMPASVSAQREPSHAPLGLGVDEVLMEFMSDRDRLGELTRLIGALRFALAGNDQRQAQEAQAGMRPLARRLPESCAAEELMKAACDPSASGALLAQLYLERCYKVLDQDEDAIRSLDERIRAARTSRP